MANIIIKYSADTQSFEAGTDKVVAGIDEVKVKEQEAQKTTNDFVNTMKNGLNGIKTTEVVKEVARLSDSTKGITAEQKKLSNEILNTLTADKKFMQEAQKVAKAYEQGLITDIEATQIFENAINSAGNEIAILGGNNEKAQDKVVNLKSELKTLKNLITGGSLTGAELVQAEQRAAHLADTIGDVNAKIKFLSSDTKYADTLVAGAQLATSGFQIAAGATALFGKESKDVQKAMLKLNAIMQISMGLQQLSTFLKEEDIIKTQLQSASQTIYTAVVGTSTGALKLFRIALASTGVGLLVIGLGILIANFDKIKKAITENSEGFQNFKKALFVVLPVIGLLIEGIQYLAKNFDKIKVVASGVASAITKAFENIGDVVGALFELSPTKLINSFKKLGKDTQNAFYEGQQSEIENQKNKTATLILQVENAINKKRLELLKASGKDIELENINQLSKELEVLDRKLSAREKQNIRIFLEAVSSGEKLTEAEAKKLDKLNDNEKDYIEASISLKIAFNERQKSIDIINTENQKAASERQKKIEEERLQARKDSIRNLENLEKELGKAKSILNTDITIDSSPEIIQKANDTIKQIESEIFALKLKIDPNFNDAEFNKAEGEFLDNLLKNKTDSIPLLDNVVLVSDEDQYQLDKEAEDIIISLRETLKQKSNDELSDVLSDGITNAAKLIDDSALSSALEKGLLGILKLYDSLDEKGKEKVTGIVSGFLEIASSVTNILDSIYQRNIDILDKQLELQSDRVAKAVDIADEGNAALLEGEENKFSRLEELRKEQAKKQKAIAIVQAVINTALAVTSALTQTPPASYILAALSAALGAVQIGIIASQSFKKGGQIGLIDAPSHEQGGGLFTIKNKPNYKGEYEGGEYIFDKDYTKNNLQAIEYFHKNRINLNSVLDGFKNHNTMDTDINELGGITINKHNQIVQLQNSYDELLNEVRLLPSRMPVATMSLDADGLTTRMVKVSKKNELIRSKIHD